jgi:hypothetical protein
VIDSPREIESRLFAISLPAKLSSMSSSRHGQEIRTLSEVNLHALKWVRSGKLESQLVSERPASWNSKMEERPKLACDRRIGRRSVDVQADRIPQAEDNDS